MTNAWLLVGVWLTLWSFLHDEPYGGFPTPDLAGPVESVTIDRAEGGPPETLVALRFTPEGRLAERRSYAGGAPEYRFLFHYDERGRLVERLCYEADGSVRERRVTRYLGDRPATQEYYYQWNIQRWEEQYDYTVANEVRVFTVFFTIDDFVGNKVIQRYVSRFARLTADGEVEETAVYNDAGYPRSRWRRQGDRETLETYAAPGVQGGRTVRTRDGDLAVREIRYDGSGHRRGLHPADRVLPLKEAA